MPVESNAGYAEEAADLLVRYEALPFEACYDGMTQLFPKAPSRIADIGAGTGRDAAALAAAGHRIVAIEPTEALRQGAMALHPHPAIEWVNDRLPDLRRLRQQTFDFALMNAVWMHLTAEERGMGMARLGELIVSGGSMILTLRHGPVPAGRRMFSVAPEETEAIARDCGFYSTFRDEVASRGAANIAAGVRWSRLAFRKR